MNETTLSLTVEQLIQANGRITITEIKNQLCQTGIEIAGCIHKIISQITNKNHWRTEVVKGRMYVIAECPNPQCKITVIHHKGAPEQPITIAPKRLPNDEDWIVRCTENRTILYFDKRYTSDEVRGSFAKSEKVKFRTTRPSRYKKQEALREMKNNH